MIPVTILDVVARYGSETSHYFVHLQEDITAAALLVQRDSVLYDKFSPLAVNGDGNCFYRAVSLGLYGNEDRHQYIRFVVASEIIRNQAIYDVSSPTFVLRDASVITPSIGSLIRDTLKDGCYAELIHLFARSGALSMSVQSYCAPATSGVQGVHPYTMNINGCTRGVDNNRRHHQGDIRFVRQWSTRQTVGLRWVSNSAFSI